jgi:hypothetical protein
MAQDSGVRQQAGSYRPRAVLDQGMESGRTGVRDKHQHNMSGIHVNLEVI